MTSDTQVCDAPSCDEGVDFYLMMKSENLDRGPKGKYCPKHALERILYMKKYLEEYLEEEDREKTLDA